MQRSLTTTAPTRTKLSAVAATTTTKLLKSCENNNNNNFDLDENDPWPNVDVGNLIIDLDADIMSSTTTTTTKAKTAESENKSKAAASSAPQSPAEDQKAESIADMTAAPTADAAASSTTTTTTTTTTAAAAAAEDSDKKQQADKDKDLKIKIKRTKTGTTKNPEGKLEIVQKNSKGGEAVVANGMEASASPADGEAPSVAAQVPLSADAVVSAVTAAITKQNGKGSKVKLVSSGNSSGSAVNKKSNSKSKNGATTNGKANSRKASTAASTSADGGPAAKKQKVDASVGTEMATMTEPDSLGPMDPGSSVTLEGIVWHETENGVLVINVTWRGKTYVGTLLDSTRHVDQWAPPRYSDSPTSELENRSTKGSRSSKRNRGTANEAEPRKVLRSSKGKNRLGGAAGSNAASPAKDKRKGRGGADSDADDRSKRQRTSSRNSPEKSDDDSEKEKEKENEDKKDEKNEDDTMTPKDKEDEKYVPPPPLPYAVPCPKPGCNKQFRHHNGLSYHVSSAHPELLNENGEIRDRSEIEKMELEAKERLKRKEENGGVDSAESSGPSSKTSTPGPADANAIKTEGEDKKVPLALNQIHSPNFSKQLPGPPPNAKPIPVSAIEGVLARPPLPILAAGAPVSTVTVTAGCLPTVSSSSALIGNLALAPKAAPGNSKPIIRPPINARPIVPATGPLAAGGSLGGQGAINLKPIQPRPTIMADPTPNLALDELRKKKEPKKKKDNGSSPGNSPPRLLNGSGHSPKTNGSGNNGLAHHEGGNGMTVQQPVKSPAYSDISDDETEKKKSESSKPAGGLALPPPPASYVPPFPYNPYLPPVVSSGSPQLPQVPVSSMSMSPSSRAITTVVSSAPVASTTAASAALASMAMQSPRSIDYHKLLQSYGLPPMPNIPPGVDPATHLQLLATDPGYKAKFEHERALKEKQLKEQLERENREKELKQRAAAERNARTPEDLRKKEASSGLSVKSEFRMDSSKSESRSRGSTPKPNDEGAKPTMETRGPPPGNNPYGFMHPSMRPGFPGGYPFDLAAMNPLLMAAGLNQFGLPPGPHGMRPPFGFPGGPGGSPGDMHRPPFPPTSRSNEELSRAAAAIAAAGNSPGANSKVLEMLQNSGLYGGNHKIHELGERGGKSPGAGRKTSSPKTQSPGPRKDKTPSPAPPPRTSSASGSRSPPPLRHVHTHTHTHFGMPFPFPTPGQAPGAAPHPLGAGFPNPLLPSSKPSSIPGFPPK